MEFKYTFIGIVLPERAQLSIDFILSLGLIDNGNGLFRCSIINNQLIAVLTIDKNIDVMTLKNIAHYIIQSNLSLLGFYSGIFYDVKIDRIYNDELTVNYVYGVANTDIQNFLGEIDVAVMINKIRPKTVGASGFMLNRALNDLMNALRSADDSAFFCYRAIESLRNHNSLLKSITSKSDNPHWESFRQTSGCSRPEIEEVKIFADDLRHGKPVAMTAEEVKHVLETTWGIVSKYLDNI